VEVGKNVINVDGDGLELGALFEIEVVQDVVVVLEEVQIAVRTLAAKSVDTDDVFLGSFSPFA
jgi:hypothetical protein